MNTVNEIVFCKAVYDNNRERMYNAVRDQIKLLMEQEYICTIYDDDVDIIVIRFEHNDKKDYWGCTNPYWLTPKEAEEIESYRARQQSENSSNSIQE